MPDGHRPTRDQVLADLRQTISEATGFDNGAKFGAEDEVRAYFTVEAMRGMGFESIPSASQLSDWADSVIEHAWHCTREIHEREGGRE